MRPVKGIIKALSNPIGTVQVLYASSNQPFCGIIRTALQKLTHVDHKGATKFSEACTNKLLSATTTHYAGEDVLSLSKKRAMCICNYERKTSPLSMKYSFHRKIGFLTCFFDKIFEGLYSVQKMLWKIYIKFYSFSRSIVSLAPF